MFVYWIMFALIGCAAFAERSSDSRRPLLAMALLCVLITALVGLRFEVGADYYNYMEIFEETARLELGRAIERGDPAYQLLNWLVAEAGWEQWVVNLVCAAIFTWGLARFARAQPAPMATLLVAFPYLVLVVANGYTRQSVAIGLILAGLAQVIRGGSVLRFALYVTIAATFHRTAVVVLPLVILASERNKFVNLIAGAAVLVLLYDLLLAESVDTLVENYIEARYGSQGAAIRVAMSAVPAALLFLFGGRLGFDRQEHATWRLFALASLSMVPLLILLPSSTAVDRVALYLLPIQLAVIPRLLRGLGTEMFGKLALVLYCFLIQFVWLNFAAHARYWIPYQTVFDEAARGKRGER